METVYTYRHIDVIMQPSNKTDNMTDMLGAGSIGSGGYGCVFLPALKCDEDPKKDNTRLPHTKYVTKLMTNNHAEIEFRLIRAFDKRLRAIPNYADYFLVANVAKCRPGPLTRRDLRAYDKQCKPLIKKKITRKNINRSLHKVTALLIPYGGDTIDDYWMAHVNSYSAMETMIASMHTLLVRGILPMNKLGLNHGDVKSSNVMYYQGKSKLIDWGLAFDTSNKSDQNGDGVSRLATYRPFQFNLPPSCILFNDKFRDAVDDFLETAEQPKPSRDAILDFVAGFVGDWNQIRGVGSVSILVTLFDELVPYAAKTCDIPLTIATGAYVAGNPEVPAFAVHYIANILEKYIRGGELHLEEYYHETYLKNLDVWGFVISFSVLFNLLCKNSATLNHTEKDSLRSLCKMFIHIIEMDVDPIDTDRVAGHVDEVRGNYRM